jgi:hypothetical protein
MDERPGCAKTISQVSYCHNSRGEIFHEGRQNGLATLITFLKYNTHLIHQTTKALERANKKKRFEQLFTKLDYAQSEPLFLQTYLALREVEVRGLRLLHEVAVLKLMLEHEQKARERERQLERQYKEQERGNGKETVIISKDDLKDQEKLVNKDRKRAQEATFELVELFLAQHQTLVQAGRAFKILDRKFELVDPGTDRKILRLYGRLGGTKTLLLKHTQEDVDGPKPLALAKRLEHTRKNLRQQLTALSTARRQFACVIQQHIPIIGAL